MKVITAKFIDSSGIVATATGKFDSLPGSGPVEWEGEWVAHTPSIFTRRLPKHGYSGQFVEAMKGIATELGIEVKIEESGDWEVYYE